jgi:hypothetical protein
LQDTPHLSYLQLLTSMKFNPNHRHDEGHEKKTDEKRTRIAESHRFKSFAPERDGNKIKWYVDGRDYFWVSVPCPGTDTLTLAERVTGGFSCPRTCKGDYLYCELVALAGTFPAKTTVLQPRMAARSDLETES